MELNEEKRNLIVFISLAVVPLIYLLLIFTVIIQDDSLDFNTTGFYFALAGSLISFPCMLYLAIRAHLAKLDRSKVIIYMSVLVVPSITGFLVWLLLTFVV